MTTYVFHGPTITATDVRIILPNAHLHPPVKHGDLIRLAARPGDTVVIIDGLFHHSAAVRHKEILELIGEGVAVIGASSMGALRAAELYPYGMTGVGAIYQAYRDGTIEADDEVAVTHAPDGVTQVGEALVNMRERVRLAAASGILDENQAEALVGIARRLHYTERSWQAVRRVAVHDQPDLIGVLDRLESPRSGPSADSNLKHADAVKALRLVANDGAGLPRADWWTDDTWRTFTFRHWIGRYRGEWLDGTHVPFLAVLQHQQIYDPSFAERWRTHVLRRIAGLTKGNGDVEADALAVAASRGVDLAHLDSERIARWLPPSERDMLGEPEQLLRLLVRSARIDHPTSYSEAGDLIDAVIPSARIAAAAFAHNDRVGSSGVGRTVYQLRADRIQAHLAEQWRVSATDSAVLTAAARDRGFSGVDGAIEVARSFYLWATRPAPSSLIATTSKP